MTRIEFHSGMLQHYGMEWKFGSECSNLEWQECIFILQSYIILDDIRF